MKVFDCNDCGKESCEKRGDSKTWSYAGACGLKPILKDEVTDE